MNKYIYKKSVIKALKTEPLVHGFYAVNDKPNCGVCAIGAALRSAGCPSWLIADVVRKNIPGYYDEFADPKALLQKGRYLRALEAYFENGHADSDESATKAERNRLVKFVEKNFPNRIALEAR